MVTAQFLFIFVALTLCIGAADCLGSWLAMMGHRAKGEIIYLAGFVGGVALAFHYLTPKGGFGVLLVAAVLSTWVLRPMVTAYFEKVRARQQQRQTQSLV